MGFYLQFVPSLQGLHYIYKFSSEMKTKQTVGEVSRGLHEIEVCWMKSQSPWDWDGGVVTND